MEMLLSGTKNAEASRDRSPRFFAELLSSSYVTDHSQIGMLKSTGVLFAKFLGCAPEDVLLDDMAERKEDFVLSLVATKYKKNSVKSYRNYLNIILNLGLGRGWQPKPFEVPVIWQPMWNASTDDWNHQVIRFAVSLGRSPKTFSEDDLLNWRLELVKKGYSLAGAEGRCSSFRIMITKSQLSQSVPLIRISKPGYGVTVANMLPSLRKEIEALIEWKVSAFQPGRPHKARVRPISAKHLRDHLCRMVGYVQNILGRSPIASLRKLVTSDLMGQYAAWAINERGLQGEVVAIGFGMVQAAMGKNPRYKDVDLTWLTDLARELPLTSDSAINDRKARKYMTFAMADALPGKIRAQRKYDKDMSPIDRALSVRNELIMMWLVILPWRQRNIRECRVSGTKPNLFSAPISPYSHMARPKWLQEQAQKAASASYWQFQFNPLETKTGNEIHALLPSELAVLVEEYIMDHRHVLIGDREDPTTLFVTASGEPLNQEQFADVVKNLSAIYAGKPTTPHLFRDIVALEWLEAFPEDYLTLSKLLWHRNIQTTLKKYGRRFDESTGAARMDDWRATRRKSAA